MLDVAALNSFCLLRLKNPALATLGSLRSRRRSLEELAVEMMKPAIEARQGAVMNKSMRGPSRNIIILMKRCLGVNAFRAAEPEQEDEFKRKRCPLCVSSNNKHGTKRSECQRHVCKNHSQRVNGLSFFNIFGNIKNQKTSKSSGSEMTHLRSFRNKMFIKHG